MALSVSPTGQMLLFKAVFGELDPITLAVQDLIQNQGAKIEVSLYVVKVIKSGQMYTQALPIGTSALIKGQATDVATAQAKFMLKSFIENILGMKVGPAIPDPGAATAHLNVDPGHPAGDMTATKMKFLTPDPAKKDPAWPMPPLQPEPKVVPGYEAPEVTPEPVEPIKPKAKTKIASNDTSAPIKLALATALGRRVRGTSQGSVYRVVAMNDRVKVATSIKGTALSLRVEVKGATALELENLSQSTEWKGSYGSKHLECGNVPVSRVVGALLFSLGVKFDQAVQCAEDLEQANG